MWIYPWIRHCYSLLPKFQIVNDKYDVNYEVMMMIHDVKYEAIHVAATSKFPACMESSLETAFDLSVSEILDFVLKSKTSAVVNSVVVVVVIGVSTEITNSKKIGV